MSECIVYLFVCFNQLDDFVVNLPPQQLLGFPPIVHRVEEHQLYTQFAEPGAGRKSGERGKLLTIRLKTIFFSPNLIYTYTYNIHIKYTYTYIHTHIYAK